MFIDDFSRWTFTYFPKTKQATECMSAFQELLFFLKTHYPHHPVARFRCDNGRGEYDNELFKGLLKNNGILFHPSPPRTQHKNGVAERMIQTLNTRARSIMLESSLPVQFWGEMINTATYLQRISSSSALDFKSPHEVLLSATSSVMGSRMEEKAEDFQPTVDHLRRIGCVAYHRIPNEDIPNKTSLKFGPCAKRCIMLGYTDSKKIWRLWDFSSYGGKGRPIHSSDVVFLEDDDAISSTPGTVSDIDVVQLFPNVQAVESSTSKSSGINLSYPPAYHILLPPLQTVPLSSVSPVCDAVPVSEVLELKSSLPASEAVPASEVLRRWGGKPPT
jgi:hypothetical protein